MGKDALYSGSDRRLREKAEKNLSGRPAKERLNKDPLVLIHELEVHQIELEMQNEELRRAQREVEESRQKYFEFYDFAPVGYLTFDEKGVVLELNLTAAKLLGIERKSLVNKPFFRFVPPESQDVFYFHRREVLGSSAKKTCELSLRKDDGALFHAQLDSIGLDFEGQRIIRTVLTDIVERKQAEEAVETALQRFYAVLSNMYIAMVLATNEDQVEFVNQAFCDYFDFKESPAEFVGLSSSDLVEKMKNKYLYPDEAVARLSQIKHQGQPVKSEEVTMRNGHVHLRDFVPIMINGKSYGRLWYHTDITDLKRAEEALRRSRDELELRVQERTAKLLRSEETARARLMEIETYYDMTPIGLCILDKELRYLRINERLAEMNGIPVVAHLGRTVREVMPSIADQAEEVVRQIIETGESITNIEFTAQTEERPGIERTARATWFPLKDISGQVAGIGVMVEEITEQLQLEEKLRQSQKMEAIGTLAGGIAHDFNNILAAILGFTEMVIDDVPDSPPVQRNLENILKSAMRARELVKQILAFSRKTNHERSSVSVAPLVEETIRLLRASIPSSVRIVSHITATSDAILAAPVEVQQILMNLATNASLAMREKGGTMEISLADIDFEPELPIFGADVMPGEYLQLAVKDSGTGMSPETMKRVFEPFFTTRDVGEGTGMGLAAVYGIVRDLQGAVTVESTLGIGSTFRVFLPKAKTEPRKEQAGTFEVLGGSERILFVDDEEMLSEWGQASLERLGYTVSAATDSQEALKLFSSDPMRFDLVVTDQTMPGMTGVQLAKEILRMRKGVPIILCTGHSETVSPDTAKALGIREYLPKPVARQELAEAVRRVLDSQAEA